MASSLPASLDDAGPASHLSRFEALLADPSCAPERRRGGSALAEALARSSPQAAGEAVRARLRRAAETFTRCPALYKARGRGAGALPIGRRAEG